MRPVIIVDTNALFGLRSLTSVAFKAVLALASAGYVRLLVPEVVVQELARQGAKECNDQHSALTTAVGSFNTVVRDAGLIGVSGVPPVVDVPAWPPVERMPFYDTLTAFLRARKAEIAACPDVSLAELLARDLDNRKPFADGKGFRDALIWETVRAVCGGLDDSATPVLFVTGNHKDFGGGQGGLAHADLRTDIAVGQRFEIVSALKHLQDHAEIKPLLETLRVLNGALTPESVANLVDDALSDLSGHELVSTVGDYDGDGFYASPITTTLDDTAFNNVDPYISSIVFEIFRTGDAGEMTIRVAVDADADIEGFIDKGELLAQDDDTFSYFEDWNSHRFRAVESHPVRFTLSADFTEATVRQVKLRVDEVEER